MQSLSNLMLLETEENLIRSHLDRMIPTSLLFSSRPRHPGPRAYLDACLLCSETRNILPLYQTRALTSPLVGAYARSRRFGSQPSFALCQGNRHFMSGCWGTKLIKKMHGRLSSIMNTARTGG